MVTINKKSCPTCGQSTNDRQISLFAGMVDALFRVWKWCREKNRHEFTRKEIKHLFEDENQTARFGDWVLFGGLVYKPGNQKGHFGLNMERCNAFFAGKLEIPTELQKNGITGELTITKKGTLGRVKKLRAFLNENLDYIVKYKDSYEQTTLL